MLISKLMEKLKNIILGIKNVNEKSSINIYTNFIIFNNTRKSLSTFSLKIENIKKYKVYGIIRVIS